MTQSFERYEKKYIISKTQASEMIAFLKLHMALDRHHNPKHILPYKIHSYYLDDHDARIIKKSIEKIRNVIPIVLLVSVRTLELVESSTCFCKIAPKGKAQRCRSARMSLTFGLLLLV